MKTQDDIEEAIDGGWLTCAHCRKKALLDTANQLHDWRVSVDMHGGGPGQPYLWEV